MNQDFGLALGGTPAPLSRMRRAAARHLTRAWEAPAFTVSADVDMTGVLASREPGVTVTDGLIAATVPTLQRHPYVNAWFVADDVMTFARTHLGIAVATDAGLVVPVMRDAQDRDLAGISRARAELVAKARSQSLTMDDVTGATFTITNLGMFGIARFTAILNPPGVGILAVGATSDRFRRHDGGGSWRPIAELTLTCDHRAVDGAQAAAFLADLISSIEATGS